jgi:hypothetical protein
MTRGASPAREVFEVLETSLANPIVVVLRGVALMEGVRRLFFRKFGTAECAEVTTPLWICHVQRGRLCRNYSGQKDREVILCPLK